MATAPLHDQDGARVCVAVPGRISAAPFMEEELHALVHLVQAHRANKAIGARIEANGVLTQQDTFGHGTFMAGIIAGRGTTSPSSGLAAAPADVQLGVAPDANLLAVSAWS